MNLNTVRNLGPVRIARILASYAKARLAPIRNEKSLEDFIINRFGRELYLTFFQGLHRKKSGACPARKSARNGARSGSRVCRLPRP